MRDVSAGCPVGIDAGKNPAYMFGDEFLIMFLLGPIAFELLVLIRADPALGGHPRMRLGPARHREIDPADGSHFWRDWRTAMTRSKRSGSMILG